MMGDTYRINDLKEPSHDKNLQQTRQLDNDTLLRLYSLKDANPQQFAIEVLTQIGNSTLGNIDILNSQSDFRKNRLFPHRVQVNGKTQYNWNPPIPQYPYVYIDLDKKPEGMSDEEWHRKVNTLITKTDPMRYPVEIVSEVNPEKIDVEHPDHREGTSIIFSNRIVPVMWDQYIGKLGTISEAKKIIEDNFPKPIQGEVPVALGSVDTGIRREGLVQSYHKNMVTYLLSIFGQSNKQSDELGRFPTEKEIYDFVGKFITLYNKCQKHYWGTILPYQQQYAKAVAIERNGGEAVFPEKPAELTFDLEETKLIALMKKHGLEFKFPTVDMVLNYSPEIEIKYGEYGKSYNDKRARANLMRDPDKWTVPVPDPVESRSLYPREGSEAILKDIPLISVLNKFGDKYIVSPFGTFYYSSKERPSFLKGMINGNMELRKKEKKAMLAAKKNNDIVKEKFHNNGQTTIKYNMNSMPGSMGSQYNFLSNRPNFNSVTSIARFFIQNSYAHAERFLEANFYFRNEEQLMNFLVTCKQYGPDHREVERIVTALNLKIPTWMEVYTFLVGCLNEYTMLMHPNEDYTTIKLFISRLNVGELCFLYYMSNMKHLVQENSDFFRQWINCLFTPPPLDNLDGVDPEEIRKIDGDLAIVISTVYSQWFPLNKHGNSISIYDAIDDAPELAKKLVLIGRHMKTMMDGIWGAFEIFMNHKVGIGYVTEHRQMKRKAIILSDTDSIIFTTKSWLQWYTGKLQLDQTAFSLNSLVVYWLTKANAYILYNVSKAFGATGKDLYKMAMKNEFMMPVEILTTLKKHYASILKIQEGVVYSTPRLDIKGVGLRGSDYCQDTLNYARHFIASTIDSIYKTGKVSIQEKLIETCQFERYVYASLLKGETRFLTVEPVKTADEYKTAESGIYFNYTFWEEVFAEKYGSIAVPTKCYILPLTNVRQMTYRQRLADRHKDIYDKLMAFLEAHPGKEITRIPINPLTNEIPDELRPIINYRAVIYANARPMYIILQSLGYNFGNGKQVYLACDRFGWPDDQGDKHVEEWLKAD